MSLMTVFEFKDGLLRLGGAANLDELDPFHRQTVLGMASHYLVTSDAKRRELDAEMRRALAERNL